MRIVFVGASDRVLYAVKELIKNGHEVIIIEINKEKIEKLSEELDCGLIHGDGSNPTILQETKPKAVDYLFGFTNSDHNNIIIGVLSKSLGFEKVVVVIRDTTYENICKELELKNIFIPSQTVGNAVVNYIEKGDSGEMNEYIKDSADLFKIVISEENKGPITNLALPSNVLPICFYRNQKFQFYSEKVSFEPNDELILLINKSELERLEKKFNKFKGKFSIKQ